MVKDFRRSPILDALAEREPRIGQGKLSEEDKLVIVWGIYKGWTTKKIAEKIPASTHTILSLWRDWEEQPTLILDLPVLVHLPDSNFRCEICGETRPTKFKIYRHVIAHVAPKDIAMYTPLKGYIRL